MSISEQPANDPQRPLVLETREIFKSFGKIKANVDVSLQIETGTIHGIIGENGAGKSTLMNILYGHHKPDSGVLLIDGKPVKFNSSADAIKLGIGMVHQHFMLVPRFTVTENVLLGSEGGFFLREGKSRVIAKLQELSAKYDMDIDPSAKVGELPVGLQQRVEILKALKGGARILILDEPTGVLAPPEAAKLFEILESLKADGVSILLITHKLPEIMAVTDNVSIMRAGKIVGSRKTSKTNTSELAELMVGRKVNLEVKKGAYEPGSIMVEASNLSLKEDGRDLLQDISFNIRSGEILGIAGVAGNGQSELLEVLSGMRALSGGSLKIADREIDAYSAIDPNDMRKNKTAHIPEDRHKHGLVLSFAAFENAALGYHRSAAPESSMFLDQTAARNHCENLMKQHDVRPLNSQLFAKGFSGGNQQKLVIAREMDVKPKVLLIGQPTRGVDIGAIEFIHSELIRLRDEGCAILLVSVELDEIFSLSDRIMVMNNGKKVGEVDREDADERIIGMMMAGISGDSSSKPSASQNRGLAQ